MGGGLPPDLPAPAPTDDRLRRRCSRTASPVAADRLVSRSPLPSDQALIVGGGAVTYHLVTLILRCPSCRGRMVNLGFEPVDAKRKPFSCRRCGAKAWLAGGSYWQREIGG